MPNIGEIKNTEHKSWILQKKERNSEQTSETILIRVKSPAIKLTSLLHAVTDVGNIPQVKHLHAPDPILQCWSDLRLGLLNFNS